MLESTTEGMGRLEAVISAGDGGQAPRAAHDLKGAFLAPGAEVLAASWQELMALGDRGDLAGVKGVARFLRDGWDQFQVEVSRSLKTLEPSALAAT